MSAMMSKTQVYEFLKDPRNKLAVLATCGSRTACPESALMGVAVTPELEIVFDTVKTSRKYSNLVANASCSFVSGLCGAVTVQYEGEARELSADDRLVTETYYAAFPDGPSRLEWSGIVYFAVRPKWIRYCDYAGSPKVIEEFQF